VAGGVAVAFCDSWTNAGNADMLGAVKSNTVSNFPGWVSDAIDPYLTMFNDWVVDSARQAARQHATANNYGPLQAMSLEGRAAQTLGQGAKSITKFVGNAGTGVASFFAIYSIYGSYGKLAGRLNP
jgi:hypothetical protein